MTFAPKPGKKPRKAPTKKKGFANIVFPTLKRVTPSLISQQIVSVQPMALPQGIIFGMGQTRRVPVTNQNDLNYLFKVWDKLQNKYPVGSVVTLNVGKLKWDGWSYLDDKGHPDTKAIIVKSEFYVLSEKGSVGFLCNESQDDTDFYFADDLIEYQEITKELLDETAPSRKP